MENTVSDQLDTDLSDLGKSFIYFVTHSYFCFLGQICIKIVDKTTNDLNRETRKFNAVKKELFEFLLNHKQFYELKTIALKSKGETFTSLDINYLVNGVNMLKLEDMVALDKKQEMAPPGSLWSYEFDVVKEEVAKTIKHKLRRSVLTEEDISQFLDNHFLVDKANIGTKCSNYKELAIFIKNRVDSYYDETVSTSHIENISFNFKGSIKDFEDEKSCCVCLEDYEEDQEVCRLPCNHFCCRNCTEQIFAIPEDGSKLHFKCPICRDDCT